MRLEVVSLQANHLQPHRDLHLEATTSRHGDNKICFFFRENPYNVSSNLSLSRAHFSKVHVFCEVHGGRTGGRLGHGGCTLPIYSGSKLQLPSSGLIAHSVALSPLNWVVREVHGGHGGRFSTYIVHFYAYTTYIKPSKSTHFVNG